MPTYRYKCRTCGHVEEHVHSVLETPNLQHDHELENGDVLHVPMDRVPYAVPTTFKFADQSPHKPRA